MSIKPTTLAAFAAPCLPISAAGLPFVVYLPPYYAGPLGLSLAVVGVLFVVVRFIDLPLDPLIGHFIDRTDTRFGRYRPWALAGAVLMFFGAWLAFLAPPGIGPVRALAGLLALYIGYSTLTLAQTAWGATLSDNYHERSRVFGWWQIALILGLLLMLLVPPTVARFEADPDHAIGIHAMGYLVMLLLPVTVALLLRFVPERAALGEHAHSLRDMVAVFRIPLLWRLMLVDLLASMAAGMAGALLLFFLQCTRGFSTADASLLLLLYFVAGLVVAPFWVRLARRTSKHNALKWSLMIYTVLQLSLLALPREGFAVTALFMMIAGAPYAAPALLLRSMLGDLSDAETLRTGQERTGLFFATLTAVSKIAYAVPVGLTYPVLQAFGFVASKSTGNTPEALAALAFMFAVPPALFLAVGAIVAARWPIGSKEQAQVAAALAFRAGD
jgi:glycoside/pentoside/hexuronide:cation symporter, GPH family